MQYVIVKTQFDKHELKDTQLLTPLAGFLKCFLFILKLLLSQFRENVLFKTNQKKKSIQKQNTKTLKQNTIRLSTVDLSARVSMKNAANCDT